MAWSGEVSSPAIITPYTVSTFQRRNLLTNCFSMSAQLNNKEMQLLMLCFVHLLLKWSTMGTTNEIAESLTLVPILTHTNTLISCCGKRMLPPLLKFYSQH
uniref:Uncharacterized protein n=1 Tax=Anguilla anguilla TaxID=7936 RepID=A0A0E9RAE0_ANGAN